jgi:hypothetical protein
VVANEQPDPWLVCVALMDNLREAQGRAQGDVLRFAVVGAAFLVLRATVSSISFAGIDIANPRIAEYALVPYAAFLGMRFVKAQRISDAIEVGLVRFVTDSGLRVPMQAMPIDWGLSRNRSAAAGLSLARSHLVTPGVMAFAVLVALGISWYDAVDHGDIIWCLLASMATTVVVIATLQGRRFWEGSFFGATAGRNLPDLS